MGKKWLTKDEFDSLKESGLMREDAKWMPEDAFYGKRRKVKVKKPKRRKGSKRMSEAKRNFQERAGWQNRHHDLAKSLHGTYARENIIWLDERRHAALHLCFGLRTMFQIAEVCLRMHNMKNGTKYVIIQCHTTNEEEWHGEGCG